MLNIKLIRNKLINQQHCMINMLNLVKDLCLHLIITKLNLYWFYREMLFSYLITLVDFNTIDKNIWLSKKLVIILLLLRILLLIKLITGLLSMRELILKIRLPIGTLSARLKSMNMLSMPGIGNILILIFRIHTVHRLSVHIMFFS